MNIGRSIAFLGLAVVLLWGCGGASGKERSARQGQESKKNEAQSGKKAAEPGKSGEAKEGKPAADAVPVQVVQPTRGDISSFLLFSSNVDSDHMVDIYPMTMGIIEKILHDEGDTVKKGDVLAVLDDREAAINEEKARLNYQQGSREFERQKEIFEREMLSKDEFDRQKFNLETARLDWEQKKLLLSYTRITSPIDGVVSKRYIKVGNKINTSQLAFSVVQIREKIAVVNIPEQEIGNLFLKQKAIVNSANREVPGQVSRISPAIDPESGTFKVTVVLRDPDNRLAVGQFVNVKIIKKVHENVVLLTKDALVFEGGRVFVFVVGADDKAEKRQIKIGFDDGTQVEVLEDLGESDRVVTAGKSSLKTDTLVKVIEPIT